MSEPIVWLTIFVLSVFVGIEVISKVSSTLHTPLMSGANAIHGVILLGAILVTGSTDSTAALVVGLVAIVLASVNMVGGFVVTDRMLQMFTRRKPVAADKEAGR
jgi:NAD(P) transhydrogenase subunit alpha